MAGRLLVVSPNCTAHLDGSGAAAHPSMLEARRDKSAGETTKPPQTNRVSCRGSPFSRWLSMLPCSPHSARCTLDAVCPQSSQTATSASPFAVLMHVWMLSSETCITWVAPCSNHSYTHTGWFRSFFDDDAYAVDVCRYPRSIREGVLSYACYARLLSGLCGRCTGGRGLA